MVPCGASMLLLLCLMQMAKVRASRVKHQTLEIVRNHFVMPAMIERYQSFRVRASIVFRATYFGGPVLVQQFKSYEVYIYYFILQ